MKQSLHFVFRAAGSQTPFLTRDGSLFIWNQIRRRLDRCLALVIMPNHGHLLVDIEDKDRAERAIRLSLLSFKRSTPTLWDPIPDPTLIPDIKHLRRQIRYVHLNPCRSHLTPDPLSWEFSTHWDFMNYSVGSFSVPLVQNLGFSSKAQFHKYISSDSSTLTEGTELPLLTSDLNGFPIVALDRVSELSKKLTRSPADGLNKTGTARQLFYSLSAAAGYTNQTLIAQYLKISQQSVSEFLARGRVLQYPPELARRLLLDPRIK
jgi:REP element-mobilizing transposase RayT